MAKVFLSVYDNADGGAAQQYFEQQRVPYESVLFGGGSVGEWLEALRRQGTSDDVAIAILPELWMPSSWSADILAQATAITAELATRRIILVRADARTAGLATLLNDLSSVASAFSFSGEEELRRLLSESTSHLAGQAPSSPLPPPFAPLFIEAGVEGSGVADEVSAVDRLGFEPYVNAVAAFLTNANTPAPLTMSVEGPWGSGKSSFMRQLEDNLKRKEFRTIRFNAWRHEKAEELWAAFALHFLKCIKPAGKWRRWRAEARLAWKQFDLASGWSDLLRVVLWFLILALASMTLIGIAVVLGPRGIAWFAAKHASSSLGETLESWLGPALGTGGWLVGAAGLLTLWQKFFASVKSPLEIDLRKYLRRPDYESKLTFLERFQQDLRDATDVYLADGKKVFVFIDDLDRCELPQAAELMRAINLMLSDSGPIVFVIGMDREKVAAALAVKHERLLPYLTNEAPRKAADGELADSLQGLFFGYGFIEKFIQIPFAVPEPTETNIDALLASMRPEAQSTTQASAASANTVSPRRSEGAAASTSAQSVSTARLHDFIRQLEEETTDFAALVKLVVPALGNNPRRIKQFVNIFRLRVLIAFATDLFVAPEDTPIERQITFGKLAKFTAIELRWPLLLTHLDSEPDLIAKLERIALRRTKGEQPSFRAEYWSGKAELMMLLRAGIDGAGRMEGEWLLGTIDVAKLTRVSVKQPRPDWTAETRPATPAPAPAPAGTVDDLNTLVELPDPVARIRAEVMNFDPLGMATHTITSPIVGTFYRQAPDTPPFVEVGSSVKSGQVLCIIEAMKLMNEIESDVDGVITKIYAQNGEPVDYGTPLFDLKT